MSLANAQAHWGIDMPLWVRRLAEACDASSQAAVSRKLGYSGSSAISSVLKNSYGAGLANIEQAVRGALMGETLMCPVAGELAKDACRAHQKRAAVFSASSPQRVAFFKACRGGCPHSQYSAGGGDAER